MTSLLTSLDQIPKELRGSVIAVGNFDGVHKGHAQLVSQLSRLGKQLRAPVLVLTFDPPPILLLKPNIPRLPPITSIPRRAELLGKLGVDAVLALPTSVDLLSLSATQFFELLLKSIAPQAMVEGPNFRFGKDRQGDTQLLTSLCQEHHVRFQVAPSFDDRQGMISSSRIRQLLAQGQISEANLMLTEPYRLRGVVGRGAGRGVGLGFPTANLVSIDSIVPGAGVYAGRVELNGQQFNAAVNIGSNPTFGEDNTKVEVHILGLSQDLYGQPLQCALLAKIREVQKFAGLEQLRQQIKQDLAKIIDLAENN
jgi:riboflavin kinase / FMN adenylyltransferase